MKSRYLTLTATAVLAAAFASAQVHATTVTANFTVTATLTPKCEIMSGPANVVFAYQSFQTGAAQPSTGGAFSMRCTNGLAYTLGLSNAGLTTSAGTSGTGTVMGLGYTLTVPTGGSGVAANAGVISHTITGSMASGQQGDCTLAAAATTCAGSATHTLFVVY